MQSLILFVAQGFGAGRIPIAPGTFGSLVGLLWFFLLVQTHSFWWYAAGMLFGLVVSVWLSGRAERILNQTDPGSIVIDEIAAMPLCFVWWMGTLCFHEGRCLLPREFLEGNNRWRLLIIFVLFRFFDIVKPWPIGRLQKLPSGWGVTADDVLAAIYVAALSAIPQFWSRVT